MATVMQMHWPNVTKDEYEAVRQEVKWETDHPSGGKLHVSWFADDGFHVFDLWDSAEDFNNFVQNRLMPAVQKLGIQGQPMVTFATSHAIFAPNV